MREEPLVGILTPVYNGAAHLGECIDSVLSQRHRNWRYVVVNNCSTDATEDIARAYAKRDSRIRLVNNERFLPLLENWNAAMRALDAEAVYCKVLHADDMLLPDCLERMVDVAQRHPRVALVGAYVLKGRHLAGSGFPFPDEVRDGRAVCRETLLKRYYVFGSPSSTLLRADAVRARVPFYDESNFHADVEACFSVLQESDFGFVHQVLTYTREHEGTQTATVAERLGTNIVENNLGMLRRYGPRLLSSEEYRRAMQATLRRYYVGLARQPGRLLHRSYLRYQREALGRLGLHLSAPRLARALGGRALNLMCNPKSALERLGRRLSR